MLSLCELYQICHALRGNLEDTADNHVKILNFIDNVKNANSSEQINIVKKFTDGIDKPYMFVMIIYVMYQINYVKHATLICELFKTKYINFNDIFKLYHNNYNYFENSESEFFKYFPAVFEKLLLNEREISYYECSITLDDKTEKYLFSTNCIDKIYLYLNDIKTHYYMFNKGENVNIKTTEINWVSTGNMRLVENYKKIVSL